MGKNFDSWEKEINQTSYEHTRDEFKRSLDDSGVSDIANEVGDAAFKAAWGLTKFAFKWGTPIGWICTYAKHKEEQERIEREIRARQEEERRKREEEERRRREAEALRLRLAYEEELRSKKLKRSIRNALIFIFVFALIVGLAIFAADYFGLLAYFFGN